MMGEDLFEFFVVPRAEKGKDGLQRSDADSRDDVEIRSLAGLAPSREDPRPESSSGSAAGDDKNLLGTLPELSLESLVLGQTPFVDGEWPETVDRADGEGRGGSDRRSRLSRLAFQAIVSHPDPDRTGQGKE